MASRRAAGWTLSTGRYTAPQAGCEDRRTCSQPFSITTARSRRARIRRPPGLRHRSRPGEQLPVGEPQAPAHDGKSLGGRRHWRTTASCRPRRAGPGRRVHPSPPFPLGGRQRNGLTRCPDLIAGHRAQQPLEGLEHVADDAVGKTPSRTSQLTVRPLRSRALAVDPHLGRLGDAVDDVAKADPLRKAGRRPGSGACGADGAREDHGEQTRSLAPPAGHLPGDPHAGEQAVVEASQSRVWRARARRAGRPEILVVGQEPDRREVPTRRPTWGWSGSRFCSVRSRVKRGRRLQRPMTSAKAARTATEG